MSWRSKRGEDKAEQKLAAAVVARVTGEEGSRETGVSAMRDVLARAELERPIATVAIVALDGAPLAGELGAALGVDREVVVTGAGEARAEEIDAAFAVVPSSMPARDVIDALARLDAVLLGVVLAHEEGEHAAEPTPAEPAFAADLAAHASPPAVMAPAEEHAPDAALEALADLERAAGSSSTAPPAADVQPEPAPPVSDEPSAAEPPVPAESDELARRLAELTHREVALRRVTEVVEQQRTRLEERERALERTSDAADARLQEALARAAHAEREAEEARSRAEKAEGNVQALADRLAALEAQAQAEAERSAVTQPPQVTREIAFPDPAFPDPLSPPAVAEPGDGGRYTLQRLEQHVRDAQQQGHPQAEEWAYYLPLLREHSDPAGRLPGQFHGLVDSILGDE